MALNQRHLQASRALKSPFEKGGFRGISGCSIKAPYLPFIKGDKKPWFEIPSQL
jgi:hypothetical protein